MAQSALKSPFVVPVFWETTANAHTEWPNWFGTLKKAIVARNKLNVDKLLKLKPTNAQLLYPTLPAYEDAVEGETVDEERQREQQDERRKVDWEYECKQIERKCPMVDQIP